MKQFSRFIYVSIMLRYRIVFKDDMSLQNVCLSKFLEMFLYSQKTAILTACFIHCIDSTGTIVSVVFHSEYSNH